MHHAMDRIGRYVEKSVKIFHIETTVNNDTFPWFIGYMQKPEPEGSAS